MAGILKLVVAVMLHASAFRVHGVLRPHIATSVLEGVPEKEPEGKLSPDSPDEQDVNDDLALPESKGIAQPVKKGNENVIQNGIQSALDILDTGKGEGKRFTDVFKISRNAKGDFEALGTTSFFTVGMLCIILMIFEGLRHRFPFTYAYSVCRRSDEQIVLPEPLSAWFGWISAAASVTDEQVMEKAGLDALMLLEFLRLFRRFLFTTGVVIAMILCPIHYVLGDVKTQDLLGAISIDAVMHTEQVPRWFFWLHAVLVWCAVACMLQLIFEAHQKFLTFRFKWLMNIPEPRSTTLMVENIPRSHCSDEALRGYFVHLFSEEAIERAYVVRQTAQLEKKVKKLNVAQEALLLAQKSWAQDGYAKEKAPTVRDLKHWQDRGKPAIEFHTEKVQQARAAVTQERLRIELAVKNHDPHVCSSAGFVTFTSRRWCRLASREQYKDDTSQIVVKMPPDPSDVVYRDLAKDPNMQAGSNFLAFICVALVMFFWAPMVAITSAMTSLDSLRRYAPILGSICDHHKWLKTLLQGLLATFALKFLMSMLPTLLMAIIRQFLTLKSGAWAQLKLQSRLFIFEIIFVLFITTLGASISKTVQKLLDHPQNAIVIMATELPTASHFYLNYVILGWFTLALELSRWWNCLMFAINSRFWDLETARQKSEPSDEDYYGMGARMARNALVATLAVVFLQVLPVIGLAAYAFFAIATVTHAYLVVYAEDRKPDLGGEFWVLSLRHVFFAMTVYVLLMTGTLSLKAEGRYAAVVTLCSLLLLFAGWHRLKQFNWEILPFETVAEMDYAFAKQKSMKDGLYVQQECVHDGEESSETGKPDGNESDKAVSSSSLPQADPN